MVSFVVKSETRTRIKNLVRFCVHSSFPAYMDTRIHSPPLLGHPHFDFRVGRGVFTVLFVMLLCCVAIWRCLMVKMVFACVYGVNIVVNPTVFSCTSHWCRVSCSAYCGNGEKTG